MTIEGDDLSPSCPTRKRDAARLASATGFNRVARWRDSAQPVARVFNYHSVPAAYAAAFDRQLEHLERRFRLVSPFELEGLLRQGAGARSAAILSFDDGLANHVEVVAPILRRRGLQAIFCIPACFPDVPTAEQDAWFRQHVYPAPTELHPVGERRSLSWDGARALAAEGHRICSHGFAHEILRETTPPAILQWEIVDSRTALEHRLPGTSVDGFCWPGLVDPGAKTADTLVRETYAYSLGNSALRVRGGIGPYNIPRINLEASWPLDVVDLQLSGLIDLLFAVRRARGRSAPAERV